MEFCRLGLKLSGCNKKAAALHSDHYTQVWLYEHKLSFNPFLNYEIGAYQSMSYFPPSAPCPSTH